MRKFSKYSSSAKLVSSSTDSVTDDSPISGTGPNVLSQYAVSSSIRLRENFARCGFVRCVISLDQKSNIFPAVFNGSRPGRSDDRFTSCADSGSDTINLLISDRLAHCFDFSLVDVINRAITGKVLACEYPLAGVSTSSQSELDSCSSPVVT